MSKALTKLANRLRDIHFPDDSGYFDQQAFDCIQNGEKPKACYPLPSGNMWIIKFSLGGKVCGLGFTPHMADAFRFADMARVRFHPYRLRGGWKPLLDSDLNFSLEQVEIDKEECKEAVALLTDIEHLLLADSVIEPVEYMEAKRARATQTAQARLEIRQVRKTKGGAILERLSDLEASSVRLEVLATKIEGHFAALLALNQV